MTIIDPETGLARLPEGYFWRVTEEDYYKGGNIFYLSIIERREEVVTWLSWFGKEKNKTKVEENRIHQGYVWKPYGKGGGFSHHLTPELLRDSSIKEYRRFLEHSAATEEARMFEEESKKFLGDYPPKSVQREETA